MWKRNGGENLKNEELQTGFGEIKSPCGALFF